VGSGYKNNYSVGIIGAGATALAYAAYLSNKGVSVQLFNRTYDNISKLCETEIQLTNKISIKSKGIKVTQNLEEIVKNKIIFLNVPAFAQKHIIGSIIPYVHFGTLLLLNPGGVGGLIENYTEELSEKGVFLAEANNSLFACDKLSNNEVNIDGFKKEIISSGIPLFYRSFFDNYLPQFKFSNNPISSSLNYVNATVHGALVYANFDKILKGKLKFFYKDGLTKDSAELLERLENERKEICSAYDSAFKSFHNLLSFDYESNGVNLFQLINNINVYDNVPSPNFPNHRYFKEDIPCGLLPLYDLSNIAGVNTPTLDCIVKFFESISDLVLNSRRITQKDLQRFMDQKGNIIFSSNLIGKKSSRSPSVYLKKSDIHGVGLYASRDILEGDITFIKGGKIISGVEEFNKIELTTGKYGLQIDEDLFIVAESEEHAREIAIHINHSCDANVGPSGENVFVALRNIKKGEELTHDYATCFSIEEKMSCDCLSESCRHITTGEDWKKTSVMEKYKNNFSTYLLNKQGKVNKNER